LGATGSWLSTEDGEGMGRSGALFEVQRYHPDVGWVAHLPTAVKPVWFRSLERARVQLHAEMLHCCDHKSVDGVAISTPEFDPSSYRITDGITIWIPAWNATRTALAIRLSENRGPAEIAQFAGQIPPSNRTASRGRVRVPPADTPCHLPLSGVSDNDDSDHRRPSNRS
jgi:hypothetical protein